DPRCDHVLGGERLGVVEHAERLDRGRRQDHFPGGLAQRRGQIVRIVRIDAATGKRDLAGVLDPVASLDEDQVGLAAIHDGHQHRGANQRPGRYDAPGPVHQTRSGARRQRLGVDCRSLPPGTHQTKRAETAPRRVNLARTVSPAFGRRSADTGPVMTRSPALSESPRAPRWLAIQASELSGFPITSAAVSVAMIRPRCSHTSPSRAKSRPATGASAPPNKSVWTNPPSAITSVPTALPRYRKSPSSSAGWAPATAAA